MCGLVGWIKQTIIDAYIFTHIFTTAVKHNKKVQKEKEKKKKKDVDAPHGKKAEFGREVRTINFFHF